MYVDFIQASEYFLKKVVLKESKKSQTLKLKAQPTMKEKGLKKELIF